MAPWNVLATAERMRGRALKGQLRPYGHFRYTAFRDVLVGEVDDRDEFLRKLNEEYEKFPFNLSALSRILPVDTVFKFTVEDFLEKSREAVTPYIERIGSNKFHTRIERRGHRGELASHTLEQEIGGYIHDELEKRGEHPVTDFKDPDMVVAIETIGDEAGVALITKEMMASSRFVKIK